VLYRVRFAQKEVWPEYRGPDCDIIEMEIFEHWLEPASGAVDAGRTDISGQST
jgi:nitrile hydratase